ncbi:MAG: hypothetical protein EOM20_13270 [Spartobacteria bacterium]|nr:hypothetical protein [Spartobacteria bacterium]
MMRMIRRSARQWKKEFLSFWGRFSAFHRIVIGILLAMGIVYLARSRALDPLAEELEATRKELADKGRATPPPAPEQDEVIQEELLRVENLRRSLENRGVELAGLEAGSAYRLDAGKADANAALLAMAGRRGLHVLKNAPVDLPEPGAVPAVAMAYELAGRFASIYGFLEDVRREPLLWELQGISISLLNETASYGGAVAPALVLHFTLVIYLYHGGDA